MSGAAARTGVARKKEEVNIGETGKGGFRKNKWEIRW